MNEKEDLLDRNASGQGIIASLPPDECMRLLADAVSVGRIAFGNGHRQQLVPINFSVRAGSIQFRTAAGSLLAGLAEGIHVAFEADHVDYANQVGWSVVVHGRTEAVVEDPPDGSGPTPWASRPRDVVIKIVPTEVSGRRVEQRRWVSEERSQPRHSIVPAGPLLND